MVNNISITEQREEVMIEQGTEKSHNIDEFSGLNLTEAILKSLGTNSFLVFTEVCCDSKSFERGSICF